MKILAFDGTARIASVAVLDDARILSLYTVDNGLTQSELLLPMAEDMLNALKLSFNDIGLYAVSVGPGSFTGVRIGVALVKGLAFGKNIPCVAVSTLEALAENLSPMDAIIVPCMDARRNQVYNAIFDGNGSDVRRLTPDRAISLSQLCEELKKYSDRRIYVCGDGYEVATAALTAGGIKCEKTPEILIGENAASVARVGKRYFERGEAISDSNLTPTYLRLPQAERERLEKENNIKQV